MKEQLSFFNTPNLKEKELEQEEKTAFSQERKVLRCFLYSARTALEVAEELNMHESSCRRSVTTLFNKGLLIKTNEQKIGKYGKKNYLYKLK